MSRLAALSAPTGTIRPSSAWASGLGSGQPGAERGGGTMTEVPPDGELQVGPVPLPAGRRVHAGFPSVTPVAWATSDPLPEPGLTWWQLSAHREQSGLAPILLAGLDRTTTRPWDEEEFGEPADVSELGHLSAAELLAEGWAGE